MIDTKNDYTVYDCDFKLTMIDTGMVINLSRKDHRNLLLLIKSVIMRSPQECAESVKNMSENITI